MNQTYAQTLTRARTALAILSDGASDEASSAYEQVLIEIDRLHQDDVPALFYEHDTTDRQELLDTTATGIQELASGEQGPLDPLQAELLLAVLADAVSLDQA